MSVDYYVDHGDIQAQAKRPNPLDDDVTGNVVVYFCGLQNHTVGTKSTWRDIIIEWIQPFCLNFAEAWGYTQKTS